MRIWLAILITLSTSVPALAQSPTVTFTAPPQIATPTEAQTFTWTLYVTPRGATTAQVVALPGVTCTGTAPLACSATAPAAVVGLPYDSKVTLTAKTPLGAESAQSSPFLQPTAAPGPPTVHP